MDARPRKTLMMVGDRGEGSDCMGEKRWEVLSDTNTGPEVRVDQRPSGAHLLRRKWFDNIENKQTKF